jgi:hypothetical protein
MTWLLVLTFLNPAQQVRMERFDSEVACRAAGEAAKEALRSSSGNSYPSFRCTQLPQ